MPILFIIFTALFFSSWGLCCNEILLQPENWEIIYDGMGKVDFKNNELLLQPLEPISPLDSHAALVVSKKNFPSNNFSLKIKYKNIAALREIKKPWERLWIFFNFRFVKNKSDRYKETNYLIVKENSVELGRAFKENKQHFLFTKKFPSNFTSSDQSNIELEVVVKSKTIEYSIDQKLFYSLNRGKWPKNLYSHTGKIGFYIEDAIASVQSISVCPVQ